MNKDVISSIFKSDVLDLIDSKPVICYLNIIGLLNKTINFW